MEAGALPLLVSMMNCLDVEEQSAAANTIWILAFDTSAREEIKNEPGCIKVLKILQTSCDFTVCKQAEGALWVIMDKISVG